MPKGRRYTPEQIITKLREAEVLQSQGMIVEEAARTLEIAPQTYYRWRKEYGEMSTTPQLQRLLWYNLPKFSESVYHYDWYILWGRSSLNTACAFSAEYSVLFVLHSLSS